MKFLIPMVVKLVMNKGGLAMFGAVTVLILGLGFGVWHFSKKANEYREAAILSSQALAQEVAQTQHLRGKLDAQNESIRAMQVEAEENQRQAEARVRALRVQLQRLLAESQEVPTGPEGMNQWFQDSF